MDDKMLHGMTEATGLTRAGRLAEATALIQRLLRGEPAPGVPPHANPSAGKGGGLVIDAVAEKVEVADPPASPAQEAGHASRAAGGASSSARRERRRSGPPLRETLRDLFARTGIGAGNPAGAGGTTRRSPSYGPGIVPEGGKFVDGSFGNGAGSRSYKLYVPSAHDGVRPLPLVVMLHGCTQSPDDFAAGTRMNVVAEEHGWLVVYPAQSPSANHSKCWNWFSPADQQREQGEPSLIAGITRQVMRDYPVDPRRVHVAGLSAGGAAAAIMGMAYPDLYAAIGVHSGLACGSASDIPSAFAAMRQGGVPKRGPAARAGASPRIVPTIVFHGDQDKTVHPVNGDHVVAQFQSVAGGKLRKTVQEGRAPGGRSYSRTIHEDPQGRAVVEQWVVHGAAHAWSGGSRDGSYTDPQGPDASREMLRFFLENPHPDVTPRG
jgi:poly(hydroxyalkanoate) depolymerase family esterase